MPAVLLRSSIDMCKVAKNLESPTCTFLAGAKPRSALFQLSHCKQEPFHGLVSTMLSTFSGYVFLLVTAIFKTAPNVVLECCLVFPSARRLGVLHRENTCQVKLCSGTSYSAAGCELNANESTMYIK